MNKKIQFFTLLVLSIIFFGLFAFAFAPKAEADDFWDEFVDFLDPVKHIENIIDGRPQDNLPPIPDFSRDRERGRDRDRDYIPLPYPTVNISANPSNVDYNGSSVIVWNSNNATSCNTSGGWTGNTGPSGTFNTGALTETTTFHITCNNRVGSASDSVTVFVNAQIQNPSVNISANPSNVDYNGSSSIAWNSNNATSCNASGGSSGWSGNKNTSGTFFTGNLINTTTFYISCTNSVGQTSDQITVSVNNNNDEENPTVSLRADDLNIDFENDTILRWSSNNATRCDASGGSNGWSNNNIGTHGTFNTGSLDRDETYRITCRNNDGDTDTDSITIRVDNDDDNDNDRNDEPDVTTRSATSISTGGATLNGRVAGNGSSVRAWFEYGPNNNFGYSTSKNSYGSRSTNYSKSISGLVPNTIYYFRAVAENSQDIVYGSIFSFNTGNSFVNPVSNQPTVIISADQTNIPFNSSTNIRWNTTEATSCSASGGSIGWAGIKNIGSGFFNTGLLMATRTYTITCSNNIGSSTDSVTVNVRGQVITTTVAPTPRPAPTSIVLINSSVDLNQPIVSALDNTRPHAGDEINYTVGYQNIGTGSITNLVLQIALPQAVDYMFSNGGSNPTIFGNTLIFNLGTLKANGEGAITVRARVKDNIPTGMNLNFPATLSYIDPSGLPQSVTTNVSAQVWNEPRELTKDIPLEANVLGAGFLPTNLFGWLLLIVLVLLLILLAKYLFGSGQFLPFSRQTVSTFDQPSGKKTTTTTIHQ